MAYYKKPMTKIEILVRDNDDQLVKMIEYIRILSAPGHSFEVIVDPDRTKEEGKAIFFMDGDGSFFIKDIKKNGKKVKTNKHGKLIDEYLKIIK